MTEVWQAGKTYVPGALARPTSGPAVVQTVPSNPNFEDGLTGWTVEGAAGWSAVTDKVYDGTKSVKFIGNGTSALVNNIRAPVSPGQSITAFCVISLDHNTDDVSAGRIAIYWYNSSSTFISSTQAEVIYKASHGVWQQSKVTGVAPSGAAFASIAVGANADASSFTRADGTGWYYTYGGPPDGLVYKAVQAAPGKSGAAEPTWPPTLGTTVIDNQVTWEAVLASQIVYTARPINRSGATEPLWPTTTGGLIHDGTIDWEAITPQVTDVNCPHSKIVAIAASKVYAADNDIIRYCATVNPMDWTSTDDAGYLPYGLQTYGSNPVLAMNLYRSNLAAFNAEGMQLWQVDEDPAQTALLDALPVGSTQNQALSPVANDLIFLSSQGVRSIGVASSSTNLQAGDIGMPIDPLVKSAVQLSPDDPQATYVPALGQYWLAIADPTTPGPTIAGALGNGTSGDVVDFHYTITATGSYTVSLISGDLPAGLSMDATGHVTGTRTTAGTFVPVIRVLDTIGRSVSKTDPSTTTAQQLDPVVDQIRYLVVPKTDTTDYSAPGFDDSAWPLGLAPFANSSNADAATHGFPAAPATNWPLSTNLWYRARLFASPVTDLHVRVYADDGVELWVNGTLVYSYVPTVPTSPVFYHEFTIPASALLNGQNVLAFKSLEIFGSLSYFCFEVTA